MLYRHLWPWEEDTQWLWWSPDYSSSATSRSQFSFIQKNMWKIIAEDICDLKSVWLRPVHNSSSKYSTTYCLPWFDTHRGPVITLVMCFLPLDELTESFDWLTMTELAWTAVTSCKIHFKKWWQRRSGATKGYHIKVQPQCVCYVL